MLTFGVICEGITDWTVLDGEGKDPRAYYEASRDFLKKKRLFQVYDKNPSLALFVRRLQTIAPPPPEPA